MNDFFSLLKLMKEKDASDLHLKCGRKPVLRIRGELFEVEEWESPLTKEYLWKIIDIIMPEDEKETFKKEKESDFAYDNPEVGRYRVNAFWQRGYPGLVLRRIKDRIPTLEELNLPPVIRKIALYEEGLVLVTGPTGCGKSTTLASMIEIINNEKVKHIVTIEDPIEYLYTDKKSIINQREVGIDTLSFASALKHVLREDPDIILIGELRDVDTFQAAISACETGHLVFSTLHTIDTITTITRILDFFPSSQHEQVRKILSYHLKATICQKLVPKKDNSGLVPVCEIMIVTPMISKLIQDNKLNKLYSAMSADKEEGMLTFNKHLVQLIQNDIITPEVGFSVSPSPHTLEMNLRGIYLDEETKIIGE
ncbi:MAG: PilT/PilU family type 4a pilus ATPase [Candidatus Omnitrophica bacterium]|nr:PilT/PilU family type 4a pilus ATPase [Candidatus Omnitrophota bacterium]MCM8807244.1 PilT/PilU family type 4a pilus ATPase [Candidatus Omnitrophota bacterium]